MVLSLFEWSGCITGLAGAALLALHCRFSGYGWLFFLVSNGCWISYGLVAGVSGIQWQNIGFMLTSMIGVYRWRIDSRKKRFPALDER